MIDLSRHMTRHTNPRDFFIMNGFFTQQIATVRRFLTRNSEDLLVSRLVQSLRGDASNPLWTVLRVPSFCEAARYFNAPLCSAYYVVTRAYVSLVINALPEEDSQDWVDFHNTPFTGADDFYIQAARQAGIPRPPNPKLFLNLPPRQTAGCPICKAIEAKRLEQLVEYATH